MPQPDHITKLSDPQFDLLDDDLKDYLALCEEKLGLVPNVLKAFALRPQKLRNFITTYDELMLGESGLTKLEREMIAVVVSSANRCYYCLVAHGQAVRYRSDDPELGEMMVMNYRVADLEPRQRTILDFAWKLTVTPWEVDDADRALLRQQGLTDEDIFDVCEIAGFYNMTNRIAAGVDMMPNREYHRMTR